MKNKKISCYTKNKDVIWNFKKIINIIEINNNYNNMKLTVLR